MISMCMASQLWIQSEFVQLFFYFHFIYCENDWMSGGEMEFIFFCCFEWAPKRMLCDWRCARPRTAYILLIPRSHSDHWSPFIDSLSFALCLYLPSCDPIASHSKGLWNLVVILIIYFFLLFVVPTLSAADFPAFVYLLRRDLYVRSTLFRGNEINERAANN